MDGSIALPLGHMNRSPQEFPTVVACSAAESPLPDLVRSAQSGDRTAFGELFQRFRGFVYACALARLRNPQRSEELVSDVFAHVLTKLTQLRDPACFPSWLRRVTTRMAINASVRGFRPVSFEEGEEPEAGSATVAEVLTAVEAHRPRDPHRLLPSGTVAQEHKPAAANPRRHDQATVALCSASSPCDRGESRGLKVCANAWGAAANAVPFSPNVFRKEVHSVNERNPGFHLM